VLSSKFDIEAKNILTEATNRSNAKNQQITQDAAEGWEQIVVAKWGKECADAICVKAVQDLAKQMHAETLALQKAKPDASSLSVQGEIGRKYGPLYQAQIDASKKRVAVLNDPNAPPGARLSAMGCTAFLGRANQYLCEDEKAWRQCVDYVKADKADVCMSPKLGPYADAANTVSMLKGQGCAQQGSGLVFACDASKPNAMTMCNKFKANGEAVVCNVAAASNPATSTDTNAPPATKLGAMGCKSFLGRANQYLCEDDKAWQQCVSYVKADKADVCMSPKLGPYADVPNTVSMLKSQGCAQQGTGLVFKCAADKPNGLTMCNKFKTNGQPVVCNKG